MARGSYNTAQGIRRAVIAALLVAGAPLASSAEGGLRCGLIVGGLPVAQEQKKSSFGTTPHTAMARSTAYLPGPQVAKLNAARPMLAQAAQLHNERVWYKRTRLPSAITIANFGCTWI